MQSYRPIGFDTAGILSFISAQRTEDGARMANSVRKRGKSAAKYRLKDCQYLLSSFTLYPSVDGSLDGNVTFRRKKEKTRKTS